MPNKTKNFILKYGIPSVAIVVVAIQFFLMQTQKLNPWKGGGFGMYTEIHYFYNTLYISGLSVDSLVKDDQNMKYALGYLTLMPNNKNFKKAAKLVLKTTQKDSIHIQVWKPTIDSKSGKYSRTLIDEIYLKNVEL